MLNPSLARDLCIIIREPPLRILCERNSEAHVWDHSSNMGFEYPWLIG